ncbi:hypothetical protein ACIQBJ_32625 [Kitasatospora sp. NPDC088391]|uniref:hypothetical protein n=1 Tax=Kitasatospora sp. NPDC088391 TaxID=3364074 RepID=UPI0038144051
MGAAAVERAARQRQLGAALSSHHDRGVLWMVAAGWPLLPAAGYALGRSPVGVACCLLLTLAGAVGTWLTRAHRAVHLYEGGAVRTDLFGRVRAAAPRGALSLRIKRVLPRYGRPPLFAYALSVDDREGFGFGARQLTGGGTRVAHALLGGAPDGPDDRLTAALLALDTLGEAVFGELRITRQAVSTPEHGAVPLGTVTAVRARVADRPAPAPPLGLLHLTTGDHPRGGRTLYCPAEDALTAAELVAALAARAV